MTSNQIILEGGKIYAEAKRIVNDGAIRRDRIESLARQLRLGNIQLGDEVKSASNGRTPMFKSLTAAEANRLIRTLEQRASQGAA